MDSYNFWADLFDTYQSTADWIKALWIVSVPAFVLGLVALVLRYRLAIAQGQVQVPMSSEPHMDDETVARFRRVLSNRRGLT